MKSTSVYTFVTALVCSTALVTSVSAGPRHGRHAVGATSERIVTGSGSTRGERMFFDPPPGGPVREIVPPTRTDNNIVNPARPNAVVPTFAQSILDSGLPRAGRQSGDAQQIVPTVLIPPAIVDPRVTGALPPGH